MLLYWQRAYPIPLSIQLSFVPTILFLTIIDVERASNRMASGQKNSYPEAVRARWERDIVSDIAARSVTTQIPHRRRDLGGG